MPGTYDHGTITGTLTPGEENLIGIIQAGTVSGKWDSFFRKLTINTAAAITTMPAHRIDVTRQPDAGTFAVTIAGPFFNFSYKDAKSFT